MLLTNGMAEKNFFEEDSQLVALMREIESFKELEPNTVAFLSTKIQNIRNSLKEKTKLLQKQTPKPRNQSELKKPLQTSLAEQKKKEYFF
tara:strand:+ start:281 stop:550 length:270 start_codon:yes stop_codon:yes gene_type:complete